MKRIAFIVSWFYKTFTSSNILVIIFHICTCDDVTLVNEKSIFRENIWNLTRNVYLMSIFNISPSRYQQNILVWCLIFINTYLIKFLCWYPSGESMKSVKKIIFWGRFLVSSHILVTIFIRRNRNQPFNLNQNKVGHLKNF